MPLWAQLLVAGLWGGLVSLERRAFLQAMLARPLVAATVMGLLMGDTLAGLYIGMLLELFHLGSANLGAALPENDTLAATGTAAAASALASATDGHSAPALWSLAILLFVWLGRAGRTLDRALERYSARMAEFAARSAQAGDLRRAVRQNLWAMWPHFVLFGLANVACAAVGYCVAPLYEKIPPPVLRGLAWAYPAMASVAAAIAVRGSHARRGLVWAGAAAAVVTGGAAVITLARRTA